MMLFSECLFSKSSQNDSFIKSCESIVSNAWQVTNLSRSGH